MFIFLFLLISNGAQRHIWRVPPGYPEKPSSYYDWGDYSFYQYGDDDTRWYTIWWKSHSPTCPVPRLKDTTLIPFKIHLRGFKHLSSYGDSSFGKVDYDVDTSLSWDEKNRWLTIYWSIHENIILDTPKITQNLWPVELIFLDDPIGSIAVDSHFDVVNIGKIKGYCHRGRWRLSQDFQRWQPTGSFTMYYIPTEKFDFHIICQQLTYLYDGNPWEGYVYLPEGYDTLPKFFVKTYPDRIRRLERAVEESFRPK